MNNHSPKAGGRRAHGHLFLLSTTVLLSATVALLFRAPAMSFSLPLAAGLAFAFFTTRLLTIRLPQGDEVYISVVVGLSALAVADMSVIIASSALAGAVEAFARYSSSTTAASTARSLDAVRSTAVLGFMAPWQLVLRPLAESNQSGDWLVVWILLAGLVYSAIDVLTMALQQQVAGGESVVRGVASLVRPLLTMYLVHVAMAAVAVRLFAAEAAWAFPIALLLTLILQNSFNLYMRIRRAYNETISALAHAAELDRPHDSGHVRRVANLALAVGRRLGLTGADLERVGYAALLHDIGRMGDAGEDVSHSRRGSDMIASIPFLADVAPLIEMTDDSAAVRGPLTGATIVRYCSRYDRLRLDIGTSAALEALRAEAGGDVNPILASLEAVICNHESKSTGPS